MVLGNFFVHLKESVLKCVADDCCEDVFWCAFWVDFLQVCEFDSFSAQDELSSVGENEYFCAVVVDVYGDC